MPETHQDRRHFHRIITDKPVELRHEDACHSGTVQDVSLRGLLLELDDDWQPAIGTRVQAGILLDEHMRSIGMEGEIAHVDGRRVGLRCIGIDVESAGMLRRMVELNLQDGQLLERDLAQLLSA